MDSHDILAPLTVDDFLEKYHEQRALHVHRDHADHFNDLVSSSDIERLVASGALSFPQAQLAHAEAPLSPDDYTDESDRIVPQRFLTAHADGATIVLAQAHRHLESLAELCRSLQSRLGMRCQANVYLSPAGARGFGIHYDAHDVFIVQVAGAKTFRLYAGGPDLPTAERRFDKAHDRPGAALESIDVMAGDTLYLPRGHMHDAIAQDHLPSLHITFGVFPVLPHTVLQEALRLAVDEDIELRSGIPHLFDAGADEAIRAASERLPDLLTPARLDEALDRCREALALEMVSNDTGTLRRLAALTTLDIDSVLVKRDSMWLGHRRQGESLTLFCTGRTLTFTGAYAVAVEDLGVAGRLGIAQWADLDGDSVLALAEHLVREGVASLCKDARQ